MEKRMLKAQEEFKAMEQKGKAPTFYLSDVMDIIDISEGNILAIKNALEAGFVLGYKKGIQDSKNNPPAK